MEGVIALSGPIGVGKSSFANALVERFGAIKVGTRDYILRQTGCDDEPVAGDPLAVPNARSSRKKLPFALAPYKNAIPSNIMPVLNAPIRKYFSDASFDFRFRLSLPVKIYNGIEIISMPMNNISRLLNELAMQIPQSTKKISAKYSPGLCPIAAMSFPLNKK